MHAMSDDMTDRAVSRRQLLTSGFALGAAGVGISLFGSDPARANVTMDSLTVADDSATLADPPEAVTLAVSGQWEIIASNPPEQVRQVLQVVYDGTGEDLTENVVFDAPDSGDYQLSADLFGHPELSQSVVMPAENGQVATTELTARVIVMAVSGGEIQQEASIEDTAALTLTKDGIEVSVGGSGGLTVVPKQ